MPITTNGKAPYAPPKAVLAVVHGYRDRGLQTPFTHDVLERAGVPTTLAPRTLQALKLLDLVDEDGNPTPEFQELQQAPEEEYRDRLSALLRSAYREVFTFAEPREDDPSRVRDAFRAYEPRGQQDRMVLLFLTLCEEAGIVDALPKRSSRVLAGKRENSGQKRKANTGAAVSKDHPKTTHEDKPPPPPATAQNSFIRGLIESLPPVGSKWALEKREAWTRAALATFDLIYELPPTPAGGDHDD